MIDRRKFIAGSAAGLVLSALRCEASAEPRPSGAVSVW